MKRLLGTISLMLLTASLLCGQMATKSLTRHEYSKAIPEYELKPNLEIKHSPQNRFSLFEGFETGNFSANPWVNTSAIPWTVQSSEKYAGNYAAKSGAIEHSQQTNLSIMLNVAQAGNITFYYKVSSQNNKDYLRFLIDGVQQGQWSGTVGWASASFPVTAGTHIFTWRYIKNQNNSSGSDCTWIDNIQFPATSTAIYAIGSGTSFTGIYEASPVNVWYNSLHGQSVYTKAELNAAGISGEVLITKLGFNIGAAPAYALPNFVVRMKHTTATNVANWQTGLTTVYSRSSYAPAVGWDLLSLDTPFLWNGIDNIVVDTAFSLLGSYSSSGTVQFSVIPNGYVYSRDDSVDQTNNFNGGYIGGYRPNIALAWEVAVPTISITPSAIFFPCQEIGLSTERSFTIANIGGGDLELTRQPGLSGTDTDQFELIDLNSYPLTITNGNPATYTVKYIPTEAGTHSAEVSISWDVEHIVDLSGTAAGYLIYGDGFEEYADFALELSPWTQHDGDGFATYGIQDVTFPNQGYTGSYIAFNPAATTPALSSNWAAYSGSKYAAAFAAITAPNNDWLISPQISFGADPYISFWAKSITADYGLERFKVLYSTTGNSYSDFTNYLAGSASSYIEAPSIWTQYKYPLPAGCADNNVYIAIQCVSDNAFAFMVDDFKAYSSTIPEPKISVSPNPYSFPNFFPNYSRYQEFSITNTGNGVLLIAESGLAISGDDEFSLDYLPAFPIMIAVGDSSISMCVSIPPHLGLTVPPSPSPLPIAIR